MEWRAVDCPVGDKHKLEYLMCTPGVCNKEDNSDVPEWCVGGGWSLGGRGSNVQVRGKC